LAAFGWWFISGKFDDRWATAQLAGALKIAEKTDPGDLVVERLAALAQDMPEETIQCLDALIRGDRDGWGIHGWREHARTILAIAHQDPKAMVVADSLINYLGSLGHFEFRDLLQKK
jgi:hypothetical protein